MTTEDVRNVPGESDSIGVDAHSDVITVIDERLTVTKRIVDSGGGVRIRKIVHRNPIVVAEPLALETLEVKRVSIAREIDAAASIRYEGDVTIFPIVEERLITRKQLVLVEEVHVRKVSRTDRTAQQITLRREELIVERQDPLSGEWSLEKTESSS